MARTLFHAPKKKAKRLAKVVVGLALLVAAYYGLDYYMSLPVRAFCNTAPSHANSAEIIQLGQQYQLQVFNNIAKKGSISVIDEASPFMRHACVIQFVEGRQVGRHVEADD